jgi:hypothetical protein
LKLYFRRLWGVFVHEIATSLIVSTKACHFERGTRRNLLLQTESRCMSQKISLSHNARPHPALCDSFPREGGVGGFCIMQICIAYIYSNRVTLEIKWY